MKHLAILAAVLAIAPAVEAKCAMQHLAAHVGSAAPNGAIVMTTGTTWDSKSTDDTSKWRMKVGGKEVTPQIETLAPGLRVYRLPAGATAGELVNGTTTLAKVSVLSTKVDLLPAPKVKSVVHEIVDEGRGRSANTTVAITGEIPTDAVAIVMEDAKGKAMSFGRILLKDLPLEPYSHDRCGVLPDGTIEPAVGASVKVFWVDKYGRASAKSAAFRIAKAPVR